MQNSGRSNIGASGLTLEQAREVVLSFVQGQHTEMPVIRASTAEGLRLAVNDLKAFYIDAATALTGQRLGPRCPGLVLARDSVREPASEIAQKIDGKLKRGPSLDREMVPRSVLTLAERKLLLIEFM